MALTHQSIATINSPEFINLQPLDINPLMSSCEIKVFYLGENRNGSYISRQVAAEMAKTLRGAPIVGYYKKDKKDFADHGEQVILDDQGVHFNCLTKPYGFVSPDAKVWFQDFEDTDDFGNNIVRTYMVTNGYLWTGQFEEVNKVFQDGGKPHSMELDEKTLQGHWAKNIKNEMEFFIINDAIFSKLCILGDEVEPCFQGSSITASSFNLDKNFSNTLFSMMKDLKYALEKGGKPEMAKVENNTPEEIKDTFVESTFEKKEEEKKEDTKEEQSSNSEKKEEQEEDKKDTKKAFVAEKKEEEQDKKEDSSDDEKEDDSKEEQKKEDEEKKKYTALEVKYNELSDKYSKLEQEVVSLREYKKIIEDAKKNALINEFYMLTEEDKKDVIENKSKYTIDEIKAKLAVICFDKKVNFNLEDSSENEKEQKGIVTFSVVETENTDPEWVQAVEATMNDKF